MDVQKRVKAQGGNPEPSAQTRTRLWTPREQAPGQPVRLTRPGNGRVHELSESSRRFVLRAVGPAARGSTRAPSATDSASAASQMRYAELVLDMTAESLRRSILRARCRTSQLF